MGVQRIISNMAWSRRDQMFIAAALKLITAPAEPNVAAARTHRAPLERGLRADGGYKHLAALRPIHNYTTTCISRGCNNAGSLDSPGIMVQFQFFARTISQNIYSVFMVPFPFFERSISQNIYSVF